VATAQTDWLYLQLGAQPLALADLILCEVLQGARDDQEYRRVAAILSRLPILDTGGAEVAIASAENYRTLRARGVTIRKTIDCVIATFCIRGQHSLLHKDRDFDPFESHLGLQVIHPS